MGGGGGLLDVFLSDGDLSYRWCFRLKCVSFLGGVSNVQAEGVTELTPKGFIDWCRNGSGYERKHLYDDKKLNEAVQV